MKRLVLTLAALLGMAQYSQALSIDTFKNYYYAAVQPVRRYLYQELFRRSYHGTEIVVIQGDLLHQKTDAIVNAANESLIGAAGVAKAIQDAAGDADFKKYVKNNMPLDANGERCPIGQVRMTPTFKLKEKFGIQEIIHTVGPRQYTPVQQQLLEDCYTEALNAAQQNNLSSITFPAISTGIFGYPLDKAAQAAATATAQWVKQHPNTLKKIVFVYWTDKDAVTYSKLLHQEFKQLL